MYKWISVRDRLPENNSTILATDGKEVKSCHFFDWSSGPSFTIVWRTPVTHWMPLPTPPSQFNDYDEIHIDLKRLIPDQIL